MFELFKKPYSKEEYDEKDNKGKEMAAKKGLLDSKSTKDLETIRYRKDVSKFNKDPKDIAFSHILLERFQNLGENILKLEKEFDTIQKELSDMRGKAQGEALKINERYDKLLERAKKANEDVYNFRKEMIESSEEFKLERRAQETMTDEQKAMSKEREETFEAGQNK